MSVYLFLRDFEEVLHLISASMSMTEVFGAVGTGIAILDLILKRVKTSKRLELKGWEVQWREVEEEDDYYQYRSSALLGRYAEGSDP